MESENKIRKILFNEITFIISIVAVFASVFGTYADLKTNIELLKQDVSVIKSNELKHVGDAITRIENRNAKADERQNEMEKKIAEIMITLKLNGN